MKIIHTFSVNASKEIVWKVLTNFTQLSRWAGLTRDFLIPNTLMKPGMPFTEVHLFLGKRLYKGTFTEWSEKTGWALESFPGEGTGIPLYHAVWYSLTEVAGSTRITSTALYKTTWKFGSIVDSMLAPLAYLYIWNLHRCIKRGCNTE